LPGSIWQRVYLGQCFDEVVTGFPLMVALIKTLNIQQNITNVQ